MNDKLLPCPFCGGEARLMSVIDCGAEVCINYEEELDADCSFVHCYNCNMDFFPHSEIAREVLKAWNTRKPLERILESMDDKREEILRESEFDNYTVNYFLEYADDLIGIVRKGGVDNAG